MHPFIAEQLVSQRRAQALADTDHSRVVRAAAADLSPDTLDEHDGDTLHEDLRECRPGNPGGGVPSAFPESAVTR